MSRYAFILLSACLLACGGLPVDHTASTIDGINPAIASAGQQLTVYGHDFTVGGTPRIVVDGMDLAPDFYSSSKIVLTLPVGVTTGYVAIYNQNGAAYAPYRFEAGTPTTVAEVEPNDTIVEGQAPGTQAGGNRVVTGNLSSTSDIDIFTFSVMVRNHPYKFHVAPRLVSSITVNGTSHPLDDNGDVTVSLLDERATVSLNGGTGNYTLSADFVPSE